MLLLSACASEPRQAAEPVPMVRTGEEFTLTLGKGAFVVDAGFIVIFDSLPEDSRCLAGAQCIWEGNARVGLLMRTAWPVDAETGEIQEHGLELNTSARFAQKQDYGKYGVELRRLEPVGSKSSQTTPYTVTLLVSPNE